MPPPLPSGGRIGICAPSGPVNPERLQNAVAALTALGYSIELAPSAVSRHGFLAAPDAVRGRELEEMFERDDLHAVFCTRGGTGAGRLLESLDTRKMVGRPKALLGFSDVTALQWTLFARHGLVSYSGPLAVEFDGAVSERTVRQAFRILSAPGEIDLLGDLPRDRIRVLRGSGALHAPMLAGNLTMITTLLGTPYLPSLDGALLVIEDVNKPLYRVDRMLFHLRNAGALRNLAGLFTGDLIEGGEDDRLLLETSLLDCVKGYNCAVVTGFPFGHGADRMTLPVGAPVRFDFKTLAFTFLRSPSPDVTASAACALHFLSPAMVHCSKQSPSAVAAAISTPNRRC